MSAVLCLALLLNVLSVEHAIAANGTLALGVFLSNSSRSDHFQAGLDGRALFAAVDLALDTIGNSSGLLPGYELQAFAVDAQCSAGPTIRGFIEEVFAKPTKILVIGADCSTATEPLAELTPFWNLVQISPVSSSPRLSSDNSTYSSFLRLVSSDAAVARGIVALMQRFNWSRLGVLKQQEITFTTTLNELVSLLSVSNLSSPMQFTFNSGDSPHTAVLDLHNSPIRIIFVNTYPGYAMEILCQAYTLEMTYERGYVWLLYGWYGSEWWREETFSSRADTASCSVEDLEEILEYAIAINHFPYPKNDSEETVSGLTRAQFNDLYAQRLALDYPGGEFPSVASSGPFVFDAVWTSALALNRSIGSLGTSSGADCKLENFTYDLEDTCSSVITQTIYKEAKSLSFAGVTGPVKFNSSNGDRIWDSIQLLQYRENENGSALLASPVLIGVLNNTGNVELVKEIDYIFPDGVPQDEEIVDASKAMFIAFAILSCSGVAFAVVCLIFNMIFCKTALMRHSSPYLNMLLVMGAILFYIYVVLCGVDDIASPDASLPGLCMAKIWVASVGFTLVYGTLLVKMGRVYYIFLSKKRHWKPRKKALSEAMMFVAVGVILLVDVIYLVVVTAIPSTRLELVEVEQASEDIDLPEIIQICDAEDKTILLGVLIGYKGLLVLCGAFFAWETYNMSTKEYDDVKLTGFLIYCIFVLSATLVTVGILLERLVDVGYAVTGVLVLAGTTFILCVTFLPKMYRALRRTSSSTPTVSTQVAAPRDLNTSTNRPSISQLNQDISSLKAELEHLNDTEHQTLLRQRAMETQT